MSEQRPAEEEAEPCGVGRGEAPSAEGLLQGPWGLGRAWEGDGGGEAKVRRTGPRVSAQCSEDLGFLPEGHGN